MDATQSRLAEASRQYQIALEHIRTNTAHGIDQDDDTHALVDADRALEIAWLQHSCTGHSAEPSPQSPSSNTDDSTSN